MMLSVSLFCKNLFLNLLIAAQLCASVVFGMISMAIISEVYAIYDITKPLENAFVYMADVEDESDAYDLDSAVMKYHNSGEIELSRTQIKEVKAYDPSILDIQAARSNAKYHIERVYAYGNASSEIMKQRLKKGRWYSDETNDDVIECVTIGKETDFPIGMVLDGAKFDFKYYKEENRIEYSFRRKYKFKIVGTCGESANILKQEVFSSIVDEAEIGDFFEEVSYKNNFFENIGTEIPNESNHGYIKPTVTLLCPDSAFEDSMSDDSHGNIAFFRFSDHISEDKKQQILNELKIEAGVTDIKGLREKELIVAKSRVAEYLPLLLCFIALVILGVVCVAVLNMYKNKMVFKTYFLCGMSFQKGIAILALHLMILLLLSSILTLLSWFTLCFLNVVPWSSMNFGAPSIWFLILDFLISGFLIMATSLPILKKYESEGIEND